LVEKRLVEKTEGASVVSSREPLRQKDDRSFFTLPHQQQNSFSRQPCHPRRGPLVQSKDQLPSNASVVYVACCLLGHNCRKSPAVPTAAAAPVAAAAVDGLNFKNDVEEADSPPPPVPMANDNASYIDLGNCPLYCFYLETTGRSRQRDKIIKLAAVILDCSGVEIEDAFFSEFFSQQNPYHPSLWS
jgi:hypothetical protein